MANTAFDTYAGAYDEALDRGLSLSGESKEHFARRRIEWLASRLLQCGHQASQVLDYGCGTGDSTPLLAQRLSAASVTGVDLSEESIVLARRRHGGTKAEFSTIRELTPAARFDVAYCNGVFHHIEPDDRPAALAYIRRSLACGGYFAFWENNPWNPGTQLVMRRIPFDRDAKRISASRARRLLEAAGFDIIVTDFLFLFPRLLALLRPIETKLTRVPAGAQYLVLCRKRG
jgi:trans-aconitate methyltransferase